MILVLVLVSFLPVKRFFFSRHYRQVLAHGGKVGSL